MACRRPIRRRPKVTAHPPRQHVRDARGRRVPPRFHDPTRSPTTSPPSRSSTTSTASPTCAPASSARLGDPDVRLNEDPVRMIRAIAIAARLDFTIEPTLLQSIRRHRHEIREELASRGCSRSTTRFFAPDRPRRRSASSRRWGCSSRSRTSCTSARASAVALARRGRRVPSAVRVRRPIRCRTRSCSAACSCRWASRCIRLGIPSRIGLRRGPDRESDPHPASSRRPRHPPGPRLGDLPLARRDVERLHQIITLQRRLRDLTASERAQRSLAHRGIFREALTWMEIHGDSPEVVEHWMGILDEGGEAPEPSEESGDDQPPIAADMPHKRRRRRRRRGRRGGGGGHTQA